MAAIWEESLIIVHWLLTVTGVISCPWLVSAYNGQYTSLIKQSRLPFQAIHCMFGLWISASQNGCHFYPATCVYATLQKSLANIM